MNYFVYKITNTITNNIYIGCTANTEKRYKEHIQGLENGKHVSSLMNEDYQKHGAQSFRFDILDSFFHKKEALICELNFIKKLDSKYNTKGRPYHLTKIDGLSEDEAKKLIRVISKSVINRIKNLGVKNAYELFFANILFTAGEIQNNSNQ